MFLRLKVREKILLPIALLVTLGTFSLVGIITLRVNDMMRENAFRLFEEMAYHYGSRVTADMNAAVTLAESLSAAAETPDIRKDAATISPEAFSALLRHVMTRDSRLPGIWAMWRPEGVAAGESGTLEPFFVSWHRFFGEIRTIGPEGPFYPDVVEYHSRVINGGGRAVGIPMTRILDGRRLRYANIAVPIRQGGRVIGAVGVFTSLGVLDEMARTRHPFGGYLFAISNDGTIIEHPVSELVGHNISEYLSDAERLPLIRAIFAGDVYRMPRTSLAGDASESLLVFAPIASGGGSPWSFAISAPLDRVLEDARHIARWAFIVAVLTIAVLILTVFVIARRIVQPLYTLVKASQQLAKGKFEVRANVTSGDEVGMAARFIDRAFDIVVDRMKWYEGILDAIPFPVSVTDLDMCWRFMNRSYAERVGRDRETLYGSMCSIQHTVICRTGRCGVMMLRQGVTQTGYVDEATGHHYQINTAWLTDPRGRKTGHVEVVQDVTEAARMKRETEERNWLRSGEAELNQRMSGEQDIAELCRNIVAFLCEYIEAPAGLLYLYDEEEEALKLTASHSHQSRKHLAERFVLGEGIVGQCALERQPIVLRHLPDDYIHVVSGLGRSKPAVIVAMPFLFDGRLRGVLELCLFREFDALPMEFIKKAADYIGIAVNTAISRNQLRELLRRSQRQAEELRLQKEELRQTNAALNDQTRAMRESEAHLQHQGERLRAMNEELEAKTRDLVAQRDAIREKNQDLEEIKIEMEKKTRELETANRYKSEFLANMSHELRTPLNSILILSQLLAEDAENPLNRKQREFSRTIHAAGNELLALINDILDLSKIEAGKFELVLEDVSLAELVDKIRQTFGPVAEQRGLELRIVQEPDAPAVLRSDGKRVWQILKNLLSNAFKFTEDGHVTTRIFAIRERDMVGFAISDSGIGIPKNQIALIFEAFRQADGTLRRKYEGTGLGLSISKEFAEVMGGGISVESEVGEGSTFTLILPLAVSESSARESPALPVPATPMPVSPAPENGNAEPEADEPPSYIKDDRNVLQSGDRTVLMILPDLALAQTLFDKAHELGWKCLMAEDGEAGLYLADFYRPSAIILDDVLPIMSGWEVMEHLKHNLRTRHIPVHFISETDLSLKALRMGAVGFIAKSAGHEELCSLFRRLDRLAEQRIKNVMVIENDEVQLSCIMELIADKDVTLTPMTGAKEAHERLLRERFDLIILDLGLNDMSGFDLLAEIRADERLARVPIIVYTGREISRSEETVLQKYADSIIIKGACSPERLLDETTLFLHRVESDMPPEKSRVLGRLHNRDSVLEGRKILIIDDDMRNVFAIGAALEARGMELVEARDGREGIDKLRANPDTALVLMDIMMPEMDGYEAMKTIRGMEEFKNLPIIALTAKAMRGDRHKCIEAGANDYMAKPIDTDKLMSLLRVWLYR